jgi:hypothetical protein
MSCGLIRAFSYASCLNLSQPDVSELSKVIDPVVHSAFAEIGRCPL